MTLPRPTERTLLVTHRGCLDGTGSALIYCLARGKTPGECERNIVYKPPGALDLTAGEVVGMDEVWFVDCAPPTDRDITFGLPFRCVDHHASNARRIPKGDERFIFDMGRSGTGLFADELGIRSEDRRVIDALEAYDLGRFDDADGVYLAELAGLRTQEEMLTLLYNCDPFTDGELRAQANGAARARAKYAKQAAENCRFVYWDLSPHRVGMAVSPVDWKNDVAQAILDRGAEVAVIFDVTGGFVSLRSREGGPDCSLIAVRFGGGGHARAAGFTIGANKMLRTLFTEAFG